MIQGIIFLVLWSIGTFFSLAQGKGPSEAAFDGTVFAVCAIIAFIGFLCAAT